jgi:hypothetical protein
VAIQYGPRYATRNDEIVAGLRSAAGAVAPRDPKMVAKVKAAELSTAMALIHGGDWRVVIDHDCPMVLIRPD